jgi:hypothetical protein
LIELIIHSAHIHCIVCCPKVNGRDMKLTAHSHVVHELRMSVSVPFVPLFAFMVWTGNIYHKLYPNFFYPALNSRFLCGYSLVICEVNTCCLKYVVQRDGYDTVFVHLPLCFPACLDRRAVMDIVVARKVRTGSEAILRL